VDGIRSIASVIFYKLACTKEESKMLIVVKAPNSMRASRLQHIDQLNLSHQSKIALENFVYHSLEVFLIIDSQLYHAE